MDLRAPVRSRACRADPLTAQRRAQDPAVGSSSSLPSQGVLVMPTSAEELAPLDTDTLLAQADAKG